ncbi:Flavin reductase like domain [Carpediemonas membranifera]|uniref:Flavin reductase like domain n=1 Tax=Carpediemonas membranifera TaxID=201153 RepID=A0A8J6B9M1_9EUKA|nr:Flavin reductase like domain [Carpediemonas membranifera]|eukprot:KAG9397054.1 Flavin reductase like domain [Carpediemonas membranifera]
MESYLKIQRQTRQEEPTEMSTKKTLHSGFAKSALVNTTTVVATSNEDGSPNMATIAWCMPCNASPVYIAIAVSNGHLTNENIKRSKVFSVNVGNLEQMKAVNAVGIVSGRKDPGKNIAFKTVNGANGAPIVAELPINMECKLVNHITNPTNTVFIGEVTLLSVDDDKVAGPNIDITRINPLLFTFGKVDGQGSAYAQLGPVVGVPWAQDPAEKLAERQAKE